eukprot:5764092-Amphidinium_carterae.1
MPHALPGQDCQKLSTGKTDCVSGHQPWANLALRLSLEAQPLPHTIPNDCWDPWWNASELNTITRHTYEATCVAQKP